MINADTLNLEERVVRTNKVQKTHKGGRTMSWNVLVVVGDNNGHVGAGIGKARAIPDAIRKGVEAAKKNIVRVPMIGSTIPHAVLSRVSAAEVLLRPASPGTGVVAGGSVRALLEAAGVKDVLAKSLGSNNPINCAWATMDALRQLKRASDVARLRGKDVNDLVSKSVAIATAEAEERDISLRHGEEAPTYIAEGSPTVVEAIVEAPAAEPAEAAAPEAETTAPAEALSSATEAAPDA
jgi:small subunit ribosomal protein S5